MVSSISWLYGVLESTDEHRKLLSVCGRAWGSHTALWVSSHPCLAVILHFFLLFVFSHEVWYETSVSSRKESLGWLKIVFLGLSRTTERQNICNGTVGHWRRARLVPGCVIKGYNCCDHGNNNNVKTRAVAAAQKAEYLPSTREVLASSPALTPCGSNPSTWGGRDEMVRSLRSSWTITSLSLAWITWDSVSKPNQNKNKKKILTPLSLVPRASKTLYIFSSVTPCIFQEMCSYCWDSVYLFYFVFFDLEESTLSLFPF